MPVLRAVARLLQNAGVSNKHGPAASAAGDGRASPQAGQKPAAGGEVLSGLIACTVNYAVAHGLTLEQVAAQTGLDRRGLLDPEARLSDDLPPRLWNLIRSIAGDGPLPVHMARATTFSFFGPWMYPLRFAPDLRSALSTMVQYQSVLADRICISLSCDGAESRLRVVHPNDQLDQGLTSELGMAMAWRLFDEMLGCGSCVARVELTRDADFEDHYQSFFGVPVRFGCVTPAIVFHSESLGCHTIEGDGGLFRYACTHLELLRDRYGQSEALDPLAPVRIAIEKSLAAGSLGIEAVAAEIHTSVRSLQRVVQSHGTTVRDLIVDVRASVARELLADLSLDVLAIAGRLGYSDDRALRRAFRRWTGMSPSEYRQGLSDGPFGD